MTLGLEVQNVSKSFGTQTVVNDVSLIVPQSEFVCILGPSGCGKTTLMRIIAGLESPTSGHILFDGKDITAKPVHQRNFAMVFQSLALFPFMTVSENIGYSLKLRNFDVRHRRERIGELLELIKLPDIGSRMVSQLSGGQRQRVAIARALAQEPLLFLLDEPLSALDAELRDHMQVELRQLQQELHITTILVTHDQREAMALADTIVVMEEGYVRQIGSPAEIYRNPANRFVAGFIGQNNFLEGAVADSKHLRLRDRIIEVDTLPAELSEGEDITISVRPENVRITQHHTPPHDALSGRIAFVRDFGGNLELRIDCEGTEIIAVMPRGDWTKISASEPVSIRFAPNACTVLAS